jgi:hypothetical protein
MFSSMIKIIFLKNVTLMIDQKSTNPNDEKILLKKIYVLKIHWMGSGEIESLVI